MAKDGFKVMDSDMHIIEPWDLWLQYIEPEFKDRAPRGLGEYFLDLGLEVDGRVVCQWRTPVNNEARVRFEENLNRKNQRVSDYEDAYERGFDAVSQINAMDREGIDVALLFPSLGLSAFALEYEDDRLAAAVARAYNNRLADFCRQEPSRLYGAAMISVQAVDEAVLEVQRTVVELGFKGVFLRPNPVRGRNWHDPVYDPLWAQCEELGVPVGFHESHSCLLPQAMAERFNAEPLNALTMGHVACHPIEQMYACLSVIMGGVLERFPRLRVAFLEGNCSWLPFWLWRMDEHYEQRGREAGAHLGMKPSEYFHRQCYISVEADEELAKYVIDWMRDDSLVFSTDYPHGDSKYPVAVQRLLQQPLSADSKRKLLWDNCARLYDIPLTEGGTCG